MKSLIEQFPLPVRNPSLDGEHYMLVWWTYHERHRITVATSESGILTTYRALLANENYCDAKPTTYYKVDIVAPPESLMEKYAAIERDTEKRCFSSWVGHSLRQLHDAKLPLPAGARACTEYKSAEPDADPPDDYELVAHNYCVNCMDGFVVGTHTLDSYYQLKVEQYRNATQGPYIRVRCPSRARRASPDRPLYAVVNNTGPHREGSVLSLIDADHSGYFGQDPVQFFCHADELPMPEEILRLRAKLDEKWARETAERDARAAKERDKDQAEQLGRIKYFFEG